ncbi:hypothetical protein HYV73_04180 [Candidatus Uhrbacteria bacterium]|nr:hypothetical protein [Candidatus Uhrbacteria bacterium]
MEQKASKKLENRPKTSWLKNAIFYNILIDRFARGNGLPWLPPNENQTHFCGGDLQGIIDRLDYLQDLGINTILLSPFHPTTAYHGYHVEDLYGVDPRFGTLEILKELIAQAHKRHIRLVMDFVLNHVSDKHPHFVDAQTKQQSRFRSWFHFTHWPKKYVSFLSYYELPKLDLGNPEVKTHILDAAMYWLKIGFDGLRLDHVLGVPHPFLRELHGAVTNTMPDRILIGEAAIGRLSWNDLKTLRIRHKYFIYLLSQLRINTNFFLQRQYQGELDGVFDFFFRDMVEMFFVHRAWYKPRWLLHRILNLHHLLIQRHFSSIALLDNLDLDRFSFLLADDVARLKEATRLLFAQPQPIVILYGSETGMKQAGSKWHEGWKEKPHGDVEIRRTMPWGAIDEAWFRFYKHQCDAKRKRG